MRGCIGGHSMGVWVGGLRPLCRLSQASPCFIGALHHGIIICPLPFFVATTFEHLLLPDIVSAFQHGLPLLFQVSCSAIILLHTFSKKRDVLVSGIAMIEIRFYSA